MKRTLIILTSASTLFVLAGTQGCGEDDPSTSGVEGSKLASEVTDAEGKQICRWVQDLSGSAAPSAKQGCTVLALAFSSTQAECNELVDQCLKEPDVGEVEEGDACAQADASIVDHCDTLSVAEYESCARSYIAALKRQLSSASCADAGKDDEGFDDLDLPAECKKVEQECPELLNTLPQGTGPTD
jgi:hypothetical protein